MKYFRAFTLYEMIITLIISGIVINLSITILSIFNSLYKKEKTHQLDSFHFENIFIQDVNQAEHIFINHDTTQFRMASPLYFNSYQLDNQKYIIKNQRDTFYIPHLFLKSRLWFISQNKISNHGSKP